MRPQEAARVSTATAAGLGGPTGVGESGGAGRRKVRSVWSVPATPLGRRGSGRGFDGDEYIVMTERLEELQLRA